MKKYVYLVSILLTVVFLSTSTAQTPKIDSLIKELDVTVQKVIQVNGKALGFFQGSQFQFNKEVTITGIPEKLEFALDGGYLFVSFVNELGGGLTIAVEVSEDGHFMRLVEATIDFPDGDKLSIFEDIPKDVGMERLTEIYIERVRKFLEDIIN